MPPLQFGTPPPSRNQRGDSNFTPEVIDELWEHQGKENDWAKLHERVPQKIAVAVNSYTKTHPEFESTSRTVVPRNEPDGPLFDVWVRVRPDAQRPE